MYNIFLYIVAAEEHGAAADCRTSWEDRQPGREAETLVHTHREGEGSHRPQGGPHPHAG